MNFKAKASQLFPDAQWTGGSAIHTSIARQGSVPYSMEQPKRLMKAITESNLPGYVYRVIEKHCPDMEWLMPLEAFNDLLLVDFYRLLNSQATTVTKNRLKNPTTGNYFHRITLHEEAKVVGGVRVWVLPYTDTESVVGFRFRLEEQQESSAKVRKHAVELIQQLEPEMVEVKDYVSSEIVVLEMALEEYLPN